MRLRGVDEHYTAHVGQSVSNQSTSETQDTHTHTHTHTQRERERESEILGLVVH